MYIYIYRWGREGVRERERAGVRKRDLEMEDVIKPTEERDEKERKEIEGDRG